MEWIGILIGKNFTIFGWEFLNNFLILLEVGKMTFYLDLLGAVVYLLVGGLVCAGDVGSILRLICLDLYVVVLVRFIDWLRGLGFDFDDGFLLQLVDLILLVSFVILKILIVLLILLPVLVEKVLVSISALT